MLRLVKDYLVSVIRPVPARYGKEFRDYYEFLNDSQWWTPQKLEEYQNDFLRRLIDHCYRNVPYYQDLFRRNSLRPQDIVCKTDLQKLPYLTKEIIRNNVEALCAQNIPKRYTEYHTTGGTSGMPLGLFIEKRTSNVRLAFEWRFYNWGGYEFGDRCVVLRGSRVSGFNNGRRWERDPINNYLVLSSFDMTPPNLDRYMAQIVRFKPKAIRAYPSSLMIFAQHVLEKSRKDFSDLALKGIFTSSETLFPFQCQTIREAFGAEIYDLYGNTEQAGRFGQCGNGDHYHEFSEYGIIEIDSPDASGRGEIVATSFTNWFMPLLRYRTGDLAAYSGAKCSCGRGLPVIDRVHGRSQDVAITLDGTPIPLTAFFFAVHMPEMNAIRKIQFRQRERGKLEALVVKGGIEVEAQCRHLLEAMNMNLRSQFDIDIRYVDEIETTNSGKHRFFVQELKCSPQEIVRE